VEVEAGHEPLEVVQEKILLPGDNVLATAMAVEVEFRVAEPVRIDQCPEPTVVVLPLRVAEVAQMVWPLPALATDGGASTVIAVVALEGGHTPLVIFHSRIFWPGIMELIAVVGLPGLLTTPDPLTRLHVPLPVSGWLAVIVVEAEQML
jgi:hypothetical protein